MQLHWSLLTTSTGAPCGSQLLNSQGSYSVRPPFQCPSIDFLRQVRAGACDTQRMFSCYCGTPPCQAVSWLAISCTPQLAPAALLRATGRSSGGSRAASRALSANPSASSLW